MRLRTFLAAAILAAVPLSQVMAQADSLHADKTPSDLMVSLQFQHIKLWFAGRLGNWPLAAYELDQIESGLQRAAKSSGPRLDEAASQVRTLRSAIESKDVAAFTKAYGQLTNGCNACHRAEGKGFVTVQVPANSPFTDQLFVDEVAEGRSLAHAICGTCHVVSDSANDRPDSRIPAPSFPELASRPGFSADYVRELLASGHRHVGPNQAMPNPRLAGYQIEEIVAFFETLRAERAH